MSSSVRYTVWAGAIGLTCGVLAYVAVLGFRLPDPERYDEKYWVSRIQMGGDKAAYTEMRNKASEWRSYDTIKMAHSLQHAFGGALYTTQFDVKGFSAVVLCDPQWVDGCVHEFIARALEERGEGSIKEFANSCAQIPDNFSRIECIHGMGHSMLSLYGYSYVALTRGLSTCSLHFSDDAKIACYDGLFMEYDERNVREDLPDYRVLREEALLDPCDRLSEVDQIQTCMARQVKLWRSTLLAATTSVSEVARIIGGRCEKIAPNTPISTACFSNIGRSMLSPASFSSAAIATACDIAVEDADKRFMCRTATVAAFLRRYHDADRSKEIHHICDGLDSLYATQCSRIVLRELEKSYVYGVGIQED